MIHKKIWKIVIKANDDIIPGRGKLFGLGKRDWIQPWDAIPFVGPLNKLNKGRKLLKSERAAMWVIGALELTKDVFYLKGGVKWYNDRYRTVDDIIEDMSETEEESPSPSRSGNADVKIRGGGGTKRKNTWERCKPGFYWDGKKCRKSGTGPNWS